jgi:hypothetical protein
VTVWIILSALLALGAVLFVAWPFLREPEVAPDDDLLPGATPGDRERLRLAEERDQALAALSELEFDHRTGKISDDDYARQLGPLKAAAAAALRAHDRVAGRSEPPSEAPVEPPAEERLARVVPAKRTVRPEVGRSNG